MHRNEIVTCVSYFRIIKSVNGSFVEGSIGISFTDRTVFRFCRNGDAIVPSRDTVHAWPRKKKREKIYAHMPIMKRYVSICESVYTRHKGAWNGVARTSM